MFVIMIKTRTNVCHWVEYMQKKGAYAVEMSYILHKLEEIIINLTEQEKRDLISSIIYEIKNKSNWP